MKRRILWTLGFAGVVVALRGFSPWQPLVIQGKSMEPSLKPGQVLVMRRELGQAPYQKGDVVAFRHEGDVYIKRVAGTPGQTVWLFRPPGGEAHDITVVDPDNRAEFARFQRLAQAHGRMHLFPVRVPNGALFVIGDNTFLSVDSRALGCIPIETVIGRVDAPEVKEQHVSISDFALGSSTGE
jgi:signal peptidase I